MNRQVRRFRGAIGALSILIYLVTAALHLAAEMAIPDHSETSLSMVMVDDAGDRPKPDASTEYDCHGCFSAPIAFLQQHALRIGWHGLKWQTFDTFEVGLTPTIDTPPPRLMI